MNKLLLSLVAAVLLVTNSFAQVAPSFKYQGVARNAANAPLVNQNIGLRISILNAAGTPVYVETHAARTSDLGIFSVNVCSGTNPTGSCGTIDWSAGQFNLKVEMDPAGGAAYLNMGNSPILMAPVAAYALKAGGSSGDNDGNPTNELQDLTFTEATGNLSISQRNSVNLSSLKNDADADPANEIQTISLDTSDNSIILSKNGGRVTVPGAGTLWTKAGDSLNYKHNSNVLMVFKPGKFEQKFGADVWKRFSAGTNRWSDEIRTFPANAGKEVGVGADIVEYPVTFNRLYLRMAGDTMFRANSYNYLFSPGASPGIQTFVDVFSQANNNGQPIRTLSARMEGSGGIGNLHAALGGRVTATTGNLNINSVLTPFTGIWNTAGTNIFGLFFNAQGQANFVAQVKNFVEDHPTNPNKQIWYTCMEGPEVGAYERGTATLVNGEAEIVFSEHFELTINPTTMTVQLSPNSADSEGLAVVEKTAKGFKVKELRKGTGNYTFDWESKGVRKGYENFEVVRDRMQVKIPTTEIYDANNAIPYDKKVKK
ncbi:MAG: hypothetical protein WAS56_08115 [Saprospiraceae bacterium]|jgi:hypothetical protein|nr:hypothetical protein [Saprospiraceae bacterium]MBK7467039.1 hypothetical protein [Saprospiraceae bacterium]MBK9994828.1 hypothetical protein [Saprospiraceae bacterium]